MTGQGGMNEAENHGQAHFEQRGENWPAKAWDWDLAQMKNQELSMLLA
jgi:hypothetical protein